MTHDRFEEPVTVLVGMGLPARIETVAEAHALLQDWPAVSRSSAHAIALNACKAGIAGEIDPETVRATLVAFARRHDILAPDMVSMAPAALAGRASTSNNG
jgi:HEAT repeat protein